MELIISIFVFIAITLGVVVLFKAINHTSGLGQRLKPYIRNDVLVETKVETVVRDKTSWFRRLLKAIAPLLDHPGKLSQRLEQVLLQADILMRASEFLALWVVCAAVPFGLMLLQGMLVHAVLFGMVGAMVPYLVLRMKVQRRRQALNSQLGDALILISNSLKTGYSFLQSVELVAREMPKPIATEFSRMLREMNLGITTEDALHNMGERVNSDDMGLVITAVLIQRQVGGNLAEIIDKIAFTIRERVRIQGEIKTLTSQGRISGIIIGLLPIGLGVMLFIINPEYIKSLFTEPLGLALLGGAAVSMLIGIMLIRKIVNIEV